MQSYKKFFKAELDKMDEGWVVIGDKSRIVTKIIKLYHNEAWIVGWQKLSVRMVMNDPLREIFSLALLRGTIVNGYCQFTFYVHPNFPLRRFHSSQHF